MIDVKELRRLAEAAQKVPRDMKLVWDTKTYVFEMPKSSAEFTIAASPENVLALLKALEAADEMFDAACDDPAYAERFWDAHAKYRGLRGFE